VEGGCAVGSILSKCGSEQSQSAGVVDRVLGALLGNGGAICQWEGRWLCWCVVWWAVSFRDLSGW